jgi:hypothetical protein
VAVALGVGHSRLSSTHPGQRLSATITNRCLFGITADRGIMHPASFTFFTRCRRHPDMHTFNFHTLNPTVKGFIL